MLNCDWEYRAADFWGFLKYTTSDWCILRLAWNGKGERIMYFGGVSKREGINSRIYHYSESV